MRFSLNWSKENLQHITTTTAIKTPSEIKTLQQPTPTIHYIRTLKKKGAEGLLDSYNIDGAYEEIGNKESLFFFAVKSHNLNSLWSIIHTDMLTLLGFLVFQSPLYN